MKEIWKIVEYAPNYLISSKGRVKNRNTGKMVKPRFSKKYPHVNIKTNKGYAAKAIHTLVAEAFVDGKKPGFEIRHKDGNKFNSYFMNLEWVTKAVSLTHTRRTKKLKNWEVQDDGSLKEI